MGPVRIEISGGGGPAEAAVRVAARHLDIEIVDCRVTRVVLLDRDPGAGALQRLCDAVLADPVIETWAVVETGVIKAEASETGVIKAEASETGGIKAEASETGGIKAEASEAGVIEVGRLAGVTDAEAREIEAAAERLGIGAVRAATVTRYELAGPGGRLGEAECRRLATGVLANETVDRWAPGRLPAPFGAYPPDSDVVHTVPMRDLDAGALAELSRSRLLSLDSTELAAIQGFFREAGRDPTDAELETLAQTWSEHCAHKTFRATIEFTHRAADGSVLATETIAGLLNSHLRAATDAIGAPWVRSAFVDNAGIVAYDDRHDLAIKVETHNHPSALEPFGGANTGVGGVVRDIAGVSARPIACLDVLCFAPVDTPSEDVPAGVLAPRRIAEGVVAGIGDYGNKLGLPTVAGAVVYHPGYLGNPLVYCGSVGILPHGSNPTNPQPGDLVVALGGRTGRDGVHGATFSSADLDAGTGDIASSAVQIGDPITEKQVIELVEAARDEQLYSAITDCGAGGFSSAVGELAAEVGVEVDLAAAPRKYPGLVPWEVWISESQERMVVSVPPANWDRLAQLAGRWQVEATVIGRLTGDGRLRVRHGTSLAVDLPMDFLHDGCPRRVMRAEFTERAPGPATGPGPERDPAADLLALLAQPTIASKESIIRSYDHEVRGGTLVRPWCGAEADGPTDAAVCVPLGTWDDGPAAFALGVGINPRYGLVDPYRMAHAAVDEAVRNLVCVGADPSRIALLDNFCWGNPTLADRLGGLVRASQGCHDAALAFQAPFVSGKDSLFNEFDGRPIPGTLLITALALVPDRAHVASTDPGGPGRDVYLVGETGRHLGGSMWAEIAGVDGGEVPPPVPEPLVRYGAVHAAIAAGLVRAAHDCSEGGLAVALAEMAIAGRVGMEATIGDGDLSVHEALFAETNGRLVLVCEPADAGALERTLSGLPCRRLGRTTGDGRLRLVDGAATVVDVDVEVLAAAWLGTAS